MPNLFFFQIYVYNGTNKRKKNKLKENLYIYILKHDVSLSGPLIEGNTEMHAKQGDLFNLISH